jgi:hypothetical protein
MTFDTYDGTTGTDNGLKGTVSQYIPPLQAFWMKVDADDSSDVLNFTNSMRSHQDQSIYANRLRSQQIDDLQIVRLRVSNGNNSDAAVIVADSGASDNFDGCDAQKMSNDNVNIPEIFTLTGTEELVINHLNKLSADQELTLGFRPGKTGDFTIEATEIANLNSNQKVILVDKRMNTLQELTVGSPYSFSSDAFATNDRFSVVFKSPTGIDEKTNEGNIVVFGNANNGITVMCTTLPIGRPMVSVYNVLGQILVQRSLTSTTTSINDVHAPGIYLVKITSGSQNHTTELVLK